jgi:tetratricopeptide (TPR) repeat protein
MNDVYEILIGKVHDYEGTVNEMTGDGIMALFGAPIAIEDAPQRAIRSSLAIHRQMTRFTDKIRETNKQFPVLKMRIGIHTGPVVVGTLGSDLRIEFKAVGDTVNLASRMEGLATPGTTYVTEDTFKLTKGLFRFEALGEKKVKGKTSAVSVYHVIAPSTRQTRFDVSAEQGLTPFVGRARELEILLDAFKRMKSGRGQALSMVSEAGVGKSRLLYEFRKAVTNENISFFEGRCFSYSRSAAYNPIIEILKSNFNIRQNDEQRLIRKKVIQGLKRLDIEEEFNLPYILELLFVQDSGIDQISMSTEAKKIRTLDALREIVRKGSQIRPLIMAFEDLHWIDKSSEDALKDLLINIPGHRVLLIFTYRPEFIHTWGAKSHHSQLNLNRLSNRESLMLVSHLLGTDDISQDLADLILEKTEGIPFFIEEFVKSLKDLKIIEEKNGTYSLTAGYDTVTPPSTIQDIIMARVDSLPKEAKDVLQTGAVIEREFTYGLIKKVMNFSETDILSHLSVLKNSELIYERGIYPDATYVFKNALTREVVYDSLLTPKKKQLHYEIGSAIEQLLVENIGEHYGLLAAHFIASENYEKGAEYCKLAGKRAEKAASLHDAIVFARKRTASLAKTPPSKELEKDRIDACTTLGLYSIQISQFEKAKEAVEPILQKALELNQTRSLSQIYTILGSYHMAVDEDFVRAIDYLQRSVKISEEINDPVSLVLANFFLGAVHSYNCEFEKALGHMDKALEVNIAANSLWGISVIKSQISQFIYFSMGDVERVAQISEEAMQAAEESGDIYSKAMAYTNHGISWYARGHLPTAAKFLTMGAALCEKMRDPTWSSGTQFYLGETYFQAGEYQKAVQRYLQAIEILESNRIYSSGLHLFQLSVFRAQVHFGSKNIDTSLLRRCVDANKQKNFEGIIRRYAAEILLNLDDTHLSEAQFWIEDAIKRDEQNKMLFSLARNYQVYAEVLRRQGDFSKAKISLVNAHDIFAKCRAAGWAAKVHKELAAL